MHSKRSGGSALASATASSAAVSVPGLGRASVLAERGWVVDHDCGKWWRVNILPVESCVVFRLSLSNFVHGSIAHSRSVLTAMLASLQ
eukprot:SAG11_NODE_357_length_10240_cov_4.621142_6_plen_88_part_00